MHQNTSVNSVGNVSGPCLTTNPTNLPSLRRCTYVYPLDPVKSATIPPRNLPPTPPPLYVKDDQEYFEIEDIPDSRRVKNRRQVDDSPIQTILGTSRLAALL